MEDKKLSDELIKKYEQTLLEERQQAQKIIEEIDNLQKKKIKHQENSDNKDSSTEEESGIDALEQEVYFLDNQYKKIRDINLALKRIYDKSFGICQICGCQIQEARLKVLPYAKYCVECKSKQESKPKRKK